MASINQDFFRANGWLCQLIGKSSLRDPRETTPTYNSVALLPRIDATPTGFAEALKVETAEYTNGVGREFIAVAAHLKWRPSHEFENCCDADSQCLHVSEHKLRRRLTRSYAWKSRLLILCSTCC